MGVPCQISRPVANQSGPLARACPSIRSEAFSVDGIGQPGHHCTQHEHPAKHRHGPVTTGRSTGTKSCPTRSRADLNDSRRLDLLPLNQARPGRATVAGRLIWHGTMGQLERLLCRGRSRAGRDRSGAFASGGAGPGWLRRCPVARVCGKYLEGASRADSRCTSLLRRLRA